MALTVAYRFWRAASADRLTGEFDDLLCDGARREGGEYEGGGC
jgi:hypothetical protein